jgi:branched-chain amino acid transport system permease protein
MEISYVVSRGTRLNKVLPFIFAALLLALVALPKVLAIPYQVKFVQAFILIILATMWNLLAGFGGLVSIGQQAFIGIGAYSLVYISDIQGINPFVALALAAVLCGVFALPLSFLVFRLSGGYFAIGTWVIAEIIKLFVVQVKTLGGGSGISLGAFSGMGRETRIAAIYWSALVAIFLTLLSTILLMRSKLGLALTAIRDDETAAGVLGVNVLRNRRSVFVMVSMGFGLAGGLIAMSNLRVQPDDIFSVNYSAIMIFMVVIGGLGTIEGPIFGAIIYYFLQDRLKDYGTWYLIILGLLGIAIVSLAPEGLWGWISRNRFSLFATKYRISQMSKERGA